MSIPQDDPRLTAYALNELSATDRAAVEQQIGDSVETLLEIEAIREVAGQLRTALLAETPKTNDSLASRVELLPKLAATSRATSPRGRFSSKFAVAASCLALGGALGIVALSGRGSLPVAERLQERRLAQATLGDDFVVAESLDGYANRFDDQNGNGVLEQRLAEQEWSRPKNPQVPQRSFAVTGTSRGRDALGLEQQQARKGYAFVPSPQSPPTSLYVAPNEGLKGLADAATVSGPAVRSKVVATGRPVVVLGTVVDAYDEAAVTKESLSKHRLRFGVGVSGGEQVVDGRGKRMLGELQELDGESKQPADRYYVLRRQMERRPETLDRQTAEDYAKLHDNPFAMPLEQPLSTFSIDVDTAAYSNMRRFLTQGSLPPVDSVRIEEMVNYFSYDYAGPDAEGGRQKAEGSTDDKALSAPFAVHMEVAGCPWNADHRLVRVGLKGKEIAVDKRPVSNIVFLIDVSGSMQPENRLPLVKAGLRRLMDQLGENDRVGIVVYAGASGLALDSTNASQKDVILSSIENLQAGGSTNGGEGIQLAYSLARKNFIPKGTNRVILCTDGDFNVGITNQDDLTRLIEEESKSGVFLSVLGFGMGNLKDSTLEKLADKGNGNYAYIDTLREANKVFVEQMTGTLITIAKDVKIQIEFNPTLVGAYRLIGYENRVLAAQDFHDDTKDAGEIGAGHTVTALYEVIPPSKLPAQPKDPVSEEKLKYQPNVKSPAEKSGQQSAVSSQPANFKSQISDLKTQSSELLTIKLRYKQPDGEKSSLIEMPLTDGGKSFAQASTDFRFAASVASFGMILRHSPHRGNATLDAVAEIAQSSLGADKSGYRSEFVGLVRSAKALTK